jgi:hypothetical protein
MNDSETRDDSREWGELVRKTFVNTFKAAPPLTEVAVKPGIDEINITVRLRNGDVKALLISTRDPIEFERSRTNTRIEAWVQQFGVVKRDLADYNRDGVVCPLCGTTIRPNPNNPVSNARALRWLSEPCGSCGTRISMRSSALWTT